MADDSGSLSRNCYSGESPPSSTEVVEVNFMANVETSSLATPATVELAIANTLAQQVVTAVANNSCDRRRLGESRKLELASISGDLPSFHELGSCEIKNPSESRSCSTYGGVVTLTYTSEAPNSSETDTTSNHLATTQAWSVSNRALLSIQAVVNSGSIIEEVNDSLGESDVQVTHVTFAGPDFLPAPSDQSSIILGSTSDNFVAGDTGALTGLGKGMVAFVAILAAVIAVVLCRCCQDTRGRSRKRDSSAGVKSRKCDDSSMRGTLKLNNESIDEPINNEPIDETINNYTVATDNGESHDLRPPPNNYLLGLLKSTAKSSRTGTLDNVYDSQDGLSDTAGAFEASLSDHHKLLDETTKSQRKTNPYLKKLASSLGKKSTAGELKPTTQAVKASTETSLSVHHELADDTPGSTILGILPRSSVGENAKKKRKVKNAFKKRDPSIDKIAPYDEDLIGPEDEVVPTLSVEEAIEATLFGHRGMTDGTKQSSSKNAFKTRAISLVKKSTNDEVADQDEEALMPKVPVEDAIELSSSNEDQFNYDSSEFVILSISPLPSDSSDAKSRPSKVKRFLKKPTTSLSKESQHLGEMKVENQGAVNQRMQQEDTKATLSDDRQLPDCSVKPSFPSISPMPTARSDPKKQASPPGKGKSTVKARILSFGKKSQHVEDMDPEDLLAFQQMSRVEEIIAGLAPKPSASVKFIQLSGNEQISLRNILRNKRK